MKYQCEECWKMIETKSDMCSVNGVPMCDKCGAKRLKYAFSKRGTNER